MDFYNINLMLILEDKKVIELLKLLEKEENKNDIINELFKEIKNFYSMISNIISVKKYFIYLLKLKPNELQFITEKISNYEEYINIVEKNIQYLNSGVILIFPNNLCKKELKFSQNIMFQIINILRENKDNISLDTSIFKEKFPYYLDDLNKEQKTILKNFLEYNKPNDQMIMEINIFMAKLSNDNNLMIDTLMKYHTKINNNEELYDILMTYFSNLDFNNITDEQVEDLSKIINNIHFKKESNKFELYIIAYSKIEELKNLQRIIWKIFSNYTFISESYNKFLFDSFWAKKYKNEDKDIFVKMFFILKKSKAENLCMNFLIKLSEIQNIDFSLDIIKEIISSKEKLTEKEVELICISYSNIPNEKYESLIKNIINLYFDIFPKILKEIEYEDFFRESNKVLTIFKIFNIICECDVANLKKSNFYEKSIQGFNQFEYCLESNKISFFQLLQLNNFASKNNEFFKEKLLFYKEEQRNKIINIIKTKYIFFNKKIEKLIFCQKYLEELSSSEDIKLKNIIISKIKQSENSLEKFDKKLNEKNIQKEIDNLYDRAIKYKNMKNLKVTSIFLNRIENKIEKEEEKIKYLEYNLNEIKNILSLNTIDKVEKNIFNEFLKLFSDKDSLLNEIKNLKSYFIINEDTSNIENYLFYNLQKFRIKKIIEDLNDIFNSFDLIQTDFSKKLKDLKNKIQNFEFENTFLSKEKLNPEKLFQNMPVINSIINEFENYDTSLNIKILPMNFSLYIISKLQENSLFQILNELTLDDLRDITNSIAGSSFDINDINNYQAIKLCINELKEKCGIIENQDHNKKEKNNYSTPNIRKSITDIKFFQLIPKIISQKFNEIDEENIKSIFKFSSKNIPKLLDLFENKKGFESSKQDIKKIIEDSTILIYNFKSSLEISYSLRCMFKNKTKEISLKELIILKQLASLSQNKEKSEENLVLNTFIDLIEDVQDIILFINKISSKGFPKEFRYEITIKNGKNNCKNLNVENNNLRTITEEKLFLKKLLLSMNIYQIEAYKNYKFIKFFYGRQITIFNDYLEGNQNIKNEITNLLYYISNKKLNESISLFQRNGSFSFSENILRKFRGNYPIIPKMKNWNEKEFASIMENMYKKIEVYLDNIMKYYKITEENIFSDSIIKNKKYIENKITGFYITNAGNNIYQLILKYYHFLVGNAPPKYSLLLCNEETTLEEIMSFMYLTKFCPFYSLFIVANYDRVNLDIAYEIENMIEKYYDERKKINTYILFIFKDSGKSEIGKEILKICQKADDPNDDLRNINLNNKIPKNQSKKIDNKDYYKNIEIVSSCRAGLGKTFYIKKKCSQENRKYIPFQIGGEVKRRTIIRRLKELDLKDGLFGLHLDFSDTKQIELFEDFIFSFLIQKFYSNNEDIFCYEENVKIYVELPNGFFNFMEKFKILNEFSIHQINDLPKFELTVTKDSFKDFEDMKYDKSNRLTFYDIKKKNAKLNHYYLYKSDIQMVCNYLKFYDSMSKKNLFFYDLNEKRYTSNIYCDSEFINEKECDELLKKYFNKEYRSYHQIYIYIKILADQLRRFSYDYHLMIETLIASKLSGEIRKDIIKAFIELTNFFTVGGFDKIVSEQNTSLISNEWITFNEKDVMLKAAEKLSEEETINSFNQLKDKGLVCINEDGQSLTIITCAEKDSEIYRKLDNLYNSGLKIKDDKDKHIEIPDYTKMVKNEDYLEIIKILINSTESIENLKKKIGFYVFNEDNFFKMVQILIRIRTGVPILIMGETGCGKTSLINSISEICNYKMITLNIHAGVNDNEIVRFMVANDLLETNLRYDKFEDDIENLYSDNSRTLSSSNISINDTNNNNSINNLIIVFFDEFNTCNSLGLLTEIMCSKKCQGANVKSNVSFVGACNPYRKINQNQIDNNNALIKEGGSNSNQKLVYTVNPLTFTQLYYIFNFGSLNSETEKKYIKSIVESEINEYVKDNKILQDVKNDMIESFIKAQNFIREKNGKESVSMREARKFIAIYKFLIQDFKKKKELNILYNKKREKGYKELNEEENNNDYNFYSDKDESIAQKYCIAASIYICFYIRLSNKNNKIEFENEINRILNIEFLLYPKYLQDELIKNINLERGIAPNESLKLNLFICFIGLLTRIAVFLVGPPGCSKTLCFNILKKEMKGIFSTSKFWKKYPQLVVTSYQGSLTSTSKGIINAFKDAEKKLQDFLGKNKTLIRKNTLRKMGEKIKKIDNNNNQNEPFRIIVCVFIDEIGLCEIAPSNPLKALHTYLELDYKNEDREKKLAFVGISNWKLDAAKMNRGIYLNVINPTSDLEQMKNTALQIANVYNKSFLNNYSEIITKLAESIFNYNNYLKTINAEQIYFHGARDFYNLIKTFTKKILDENLNSDNSVSSALFSIESNYNGISRNGINSFDWIKKEFKKLYEPAKEVKTDEFGVLECIKNNLNDNDGRYLLLIMKANLSQYLILQILKSEQRKYFYYLGSLFEDDIYSEAYSAKAINKIRYYLELDNILILKNLSTTYASLYDLLNQRFTYIKNQKYAEISLGEVSNQTFVNNNLKIIVLIREEAVQYQDPPFLNRFEKYYISFNNLLDLESKKISAKILGYRKLFKTGINIKYNFEKELINFYDEEIISLIANYKIQNNYANDFTEEKITNHILEKISKTLPQELIIYINHYKRNYNNEIVDKITNYYLLSIHSNLEAFVRKTFHSINVVYTFTPKIRSTKFVFDVSNDTFGIIKNEQIKTIFMDLIKSERQIEMDITDFYNSQNKLLLIHFEEIDSDNLEFIIMLLERLESENILNNIKKKMIILIMHIKRKNDEINKDIFVPNLTGFEQTFIDNLFGKDILITDFMEKNIENLYNNDKLIDQNELLKNELYSCFQFISYSFQDNSTNQNEYIEQIISFIINNENIINKIKTKIINEIKISYNQNQNIFENILENIFVENNQDFVTMLSNYLENKFVTYLQRFIVNSEKEGILSSLIKNLPKSAKIIWENKLDKFIFTKNINNNLKSNEIKVWTKLNLPSHDSINRIKLMIETDKDNIFKNYLEEEKKIRSLYKAGDIIDKDEYEYEEDDDEKKIQEEKKYKKQLIEKFFTENKDNIEDIEFQDVKEDIKKFFIPKKEDIIKIKDEIYTDPFISSFKENLEELIDLFFHDYYFNFIASIIQSDDILYLNILIYLTQLRFGEKPKNGSELYYSKCILWTHNYREEFIFLFKMFSSFQKLFNNINVLEKVKQKIETNKISYIISEHHPKFKKLIDKPFLLIIDSFFYNLLEFIETLKSREVLEKINTLSEIIQNAEIFNTNLGLKSKDFYRFKTLFITIKLFNDKNVYDKNIINSYIKYIKNERELLIENKIEQIPNELRNQIHLLKKYLPDCEKKNNIIMKILISKYKEVTDIKYREVLCEYVLEDINLIKISNEFFNLIFGKFLFIPSPLDPEDEDDQNPFYKNSSEKMIILLNKINDKISKKNKILSENLKYIFKFYILKDFQDKFENSNNKIEQEEKIRNEIEIYLGEDSLKNFKNAYSTLMEIRSSQNLEIQNKNIKEIFCIAFCNIFLEYFVKYSMIHTLLCSEQRVSIINFLKEGETEIKKSFKLFILKEIKTKYITERTEFLNIEKWTQQKFLSDLFPDLKFIGSDSQIEGSLTNNFYGFYDEEEFINEKQLRNLISNKYHDLTEKTFLYNIDLFINENLNTLKTEKGIEFCKNSKLMKLFKAYINEEKKFNSSTKKLINLFFDANEYSNNSLLNIIKNTSYIEIILYAYRFSLLSSISNQNSLYSKMISQNFIKEIRNAYVPGADLYCDLWVESYINMLIPLNEKHYGGYTKGYYICNCGEYYFQPPCGLPTNISYCANCQKEIGGTNQKLIIRNEDNGNYKIKRIYPDIENKKAVENRPDLISIYGENFYPSQLFKDFGKEILEKMTNNYKGILEPNYLFFIYETKQIRGLSQISFRLLNFIIYSNIYFSYKCGYLTLDDINSNKLVPVKEEIYIGNYENECFYNEYRKELLSKRKRGILDEFSILKILEINWKFLEKALKQKNIENIQIFVNSIFNDLSDLIINSEDMETSELRENFEEKANEIVNKGIEKYEENYEKYQRVIEIIKTKNLLNNFIILENDKLMPDVEKEYPYYYELISIPLVEENQLIEILNKDSEKKYPVLYNYLKTNKKDVEYLKSFSKINNFINFTIEHYSNEISRYNAKSIKIKEEVEKKKSIPEKLFNEFLNGFNKSKIYEIADKYLGYELKNKIELRELSKDDKLSCFLIDDGVIGYGMQLAAIYQKYISFQNTFLNNVTNNINDDNNQKLIYLKNKINEEINPQKANIFNIVNFDVETENYGSFLEMLLFYSYRDSFNKLGEFDFSKKDKLKYNLEEIEEQLENLLLPGKRKFTNKIDFVTYQFEGFRQNSTILSDFMINFPQKLLDENEKEFLYKFKNDQYSSESIIRILFSIQLMITFYNDQKDIIKDPNNKNIQIIETFEIFPNFFKFPADTKKLFKEYPFTISHILSVYEYFELLCFDEFKKNLDPLFKRDIKEESMIKIEKYFKNNPNGFLNKLEISSAIRKFISRNLVGLRDDNNYDRNQELFFILKFKRDCWNAQIINNVNFGKEIEKLIELDIKIENVLNLYEKLGGDTQLLGEAIKNKFSEAEKNNKQEKKKCNKKKQTKKQIF